MLVETGLNQSVIGKRIMAATFVTDLGVAAALSILFIKPSLWVVPFLLVSVALIFGLPRLGPWFFRRYGDRVIEPEIKLVFASLFLLMWLAGRAHSHAVLPAFVLGLLISSHYVERQEEQKRLRVVAFAFLTPFFFLKGGMSISASALWGNFGILGILFLGKMVSKLGAVYPCAPLLLPARDVHDPADEHGPDLRHDQLPLRAQRPHHRPHAVLALVGVVVLSAIVPTARSASISLDWSSSATSRRRCRRRKRRGLMCIRRPSWDRSRPSQAASASPGRWAWVRATRRHGAAPGAAPRPRLMRIKPV